MFYKTLIASSFAALAAAQSAVLTFTHVPNPVTDGQAQAITYSTNDTTKPVTIILRKGLSNNLQTISTLTTSASGGQFIWTPSMSLADGTDYALEITQGSQLNYFGPFEVQGATASAVSSASSSSATASASAYISSTVSANGTASTTVPIAPITGTVGSMTAGTGTALPRNTTMSMATLSKSGSATMTSGSSATGTAGTTGAGSGASSTASASASSSTSGASGLQMGSALSLLFGVVAAVFYLQ